MSSSYRRECKNANNKKENIFPQSKIPQGPFKCKQVIYWFIYFSFLNGPQFSIYKLFIWLAAALCGQCVSVRAHSSVRFQHVRHGSVYKHQHEMSDNWIIHLLNGCNLADCSTHLGSSVASPPTLHSYSVLTCTCRDAFKCSQWNLLWT